MEYKAYSFDLDDNLLTLPTKVTLANNQGEKKKYSTKNFEKIRTHLTKNNLKITKESFKNFRDDKEFFKDLKKSKKAGSWKYLLDCIFEKGSIFAIITARGHSKETLRMGLKEKILEDISKEKLKNFVSLFKQKFKDNIKNKTPEEVFDIYLNYCKFYPCTNDLILNKYGKDKTISEIKVAAFKDFRKYIKKYLKENFNESVELQIGFSDDSTAHLSSIANSILKDYGFFFFQTKKSGISEFISS